MSGWTHEMAPSKLPGRKAKPCPISARKRSPSTSRSKATSAKGENDGQQRSNSTEAVSSSPSQSSQLPSSLLMAFEPSAAPTYLTFPH